MKSKLTLLSLFLTATLMTSQVRAAEEKTPAVGPVVTADKSASTDTTAPDADETIPEGVDKESVSTQIINDIIKILLKEVGSSKTLATIQARVCKAGLPGGLGCSPSLSNATIRSCAGLMCQSNNVGLNTAIVALCGDYKDFMSSACAKKMGSGKTDVKTARKIVCETALNNDVFNEVKTILKYTPKVCPSN